MGFIVLSGLSKRVICLFRSNYINAEDNYERLIDFLSQTSKLYNFSVLDLADCMMHHWFPVSFFCANTVAHLCLQYVFFFRASSSIGSSGGLIIMAHKSHDLLFLLSNCTYNSNIIKDEKFLAHCMRILKTVNPGCPSSQPHAFWSTAIWRDIRAALWFCSCELRWQALSVLYSFVLTHCRIFLQLWMALSWDTADNLCSLQWQIVAYNELKECV